MAKDLITFHHKLGAIVLECTNMSPYASDIQAVVGLPVFDMYSLMQWIYSALVKNIFTNNPLQTVLEGCVLCWFKKQMQ